MNQSGSSVYPSGAKIEFISSIISGAGRKPSSCTSNKSDDDPRVAGRRTTTGWRADHTKGKPDIPVFPSQFCRDIGGIFVEFGVPKAFWWRCFVEISDHGGGIKRESQDGGVASAGQATE
jgi:hypothetical protein